MVGLDEISANADNIRKASDKKAPGAWVICVFQAALPLF
jgi:hypothetical protein